MSLELSTLSAKDVVERLGLKPHPEGGFYAETFRTRALVGERPAASAIYFLLAAGQTSHWHKVDAAEIWLWHAGAPIALSIAGGDQPPRQTILGPDLAAGQHPQAVVPAFAWQSAVSEGAWTLVSCVVAPAFQFEGFTLAPPEWKPRP
jgi:predicted cupin superfamily sugar epimerase